MDLTFSNLNYAEKYVWVNGVNYVFRRSTNPILKPGSPYSHFHGWAMHVPRRDSDLVSLEVKLCALNGGASRDTFR
jgi:hypothetical protein